VARLRIYLRAFSLYFWQHYRLKLIALAVIILLVGLLYYIGLTNYDSYLWVNVISEDLHFN